MSELQSADLGVDNDDYVEVDDNDNAEIEQEYQSSDLATDSDPEHEQKAEEPNVNQEAIQKVINRKHYEAQEAKRKLDEMEKRLQQYEQQQTQYAPQTVQKPDPFDDDYDAKMQQYEQAIEQRARWQYEQDYTQKQQQQAQQQAQYEQQQRMQESAQKFMDSAKSYGISQEELVTAGQTVESYGLNTDLQMHFLSDPDGALMVKHLAANPNDVIALTQMSPYQAGVYIEQNLRPKAKQLKPKNTNAPPPNKRLGGGNVDPELGKYKHISGGKFE